MLVRVIYSLLYTIHTYFLYMVIFCPSINQDEQFVNIDFSENVFQTFGLYRTLNPQHYNDDPIIKKSFDLPNMGLLNKDDYCLQLDRSLFVDEKPNFITDYNPDGLARQVMNDIGQDLLPKNVHKDMPKSLWQQKHIEIPKQSAIIFTKKIRFHYFHEFHKNLFCQTQMYNHIPGHGSLTYNFYFKEKRSQRLSCQKNNKQCFQSGKFFPMSYRLDVKSECLTFFNFINSKTYKNLKKKEPVVFITKVSWGSSRGNGLEIVNEKYEKRLKRKYENGKLCGQILDNIMAQQYITNPLTLDGHKFDFRIYMLIASTDPLITYYHDGFLRVSLLNYNKTSTEKSVHFTNTALSKNIIKDPSKYQELTNYNFTNSEDLKNNQMWSMEKLADYLFQKNITNDVNWLDNYLRPQFQKAFNQLVLMTKDDFVQEVILQKQPNVFELFGLDFMLDEELNLWFLECNASPVFQGTSYEKLKFQTNLLSDMFNIQNSYLKSRVKRLRNFLQDQKLFGQTQFTIKEFQLLKKEINYLNKNYLEPEFALSQDNTFTKIMDFSIQGPKRFKNLFTDQCFLNA